MSATQSLFTHVRLYFNQNFFTMCLSFIISTADDEIYRKKLDAMRDKHLKHERSIYTFSPIKWTKPEAHSYWLKRAESRIQIMSCSEKNSVVGTSQDNGADCAHEDARFWTQRESDEDGTAASSISRGSEKSVKSVDMTAGAGKVYASFNSSSRSYERPISFSYYSSYVKKKQML